MPIHAPDPAAKGSYFRSIILAELGSRDLSRGWLAEAVIEQPDGPYSTATIYSYLRGSSDCTGEVLAVIFRVLDLHVTRY